MRFENINKQNLRKLKELFSEHEDLFSFQTNRLIHRK